MLYLGPNEATELKKSKIIFISLQVTVSSASIIYLELSFVEIIKDIYHVGLGLQKGQNKAT